MGVTNNSTSNSSSTSSKRKHHGKDDHSSYSKRHRRFLDPTILARGMSARCIGARIPLSTLKAEDIERDLRHMEAYANACTIYAQQFFIHHNRALVQSGAFGPVPPSTYIDDGNSNQSNSNTGSASAPTALLPVRIDPEEEKRISLLRRRIATSEAQREVLETEYMSLRSHYVYESQRLVKRRRQVDGQVKFLQMLARRRAKVVALRRLRCAMARDILACLQRRSKSGSDPIGSSNDANNNDVTTKTSKNSISADSNNMNMSVSSTGASIGSRSTSRSSPSPKTTASKASVLGGDLLGIWNQVESMLAKAETECQTVPIPDELSDQISSTSASATGSNSKKKKNVDESKNSNGATSSNPINVIPWDCREMPRTPHGVPILLSQLSTVPDRTVAWGTGGMFGSKASSMCWLESNLPVTNGCRKDKHKQERELKELMDLRKECSRLHQELKSERSANANWQSKLQKMRQRQNECSAMLTILRCETESLLNRHNLLLSTPQAQKAAASAAAKQREREQQQQQQEDEEDEEDTNATTQIPAEVVVAVEEDTSMAPSLTTGGNDVSVEQ